MPRIRCHYTDCVFLEDRFCGAAAVEIDPDSGCLTYRPEDEATILGEDEETDFEWDDEEDDEPLYDDDDDIEWEEDEDY